MNNQMNMGYPNQYNQMMNNNQQNEIAEPQPVKIPRKVIVLAILLVVILVVILGKRYLDYITFDYKTVVSDSLDKYYVSANSKDLEPIRELLEKYQKNAKMIQNIQSHTYNEVAKWFYYVNGKYICDKDNKNSCAVQLIEFTNLLNKIDLMYNVKGGGYFLISSNAYNELKTKGNQQIDYLTSASNNRSYNNPDNSETIYAKNCRNSKNCNCNDKSGICDCVYDKVDAQNNKTQEKIRCYKPETIVQK